MRIPVNIMLLVIVVQWPLRADLGPIRFAGDSNAIIATCTITQPGNYILSRDISGSITIEADNVSINLKNYVINGGDYGIIVENQNNISIENGTIQNKTAAGIFINTCSNIQIANIDFTANTTGFEAINSDAITFYDSLLTQHNGRVISITDCSNVELQGIQCNNNSTSDNTIFINNSSEITLKNCAISRNEFNTANAVFSITASSNLLFEKCIFRANRFLALSGLSNLFFMSSTTDSIVRNCFIINNTSSSNLIGFNIANGTAINYEKCQVIDNTSSIGFFRGFFANSGSDITYSGCIASANTASEFCEGFSASGVTMNSYISCIANKNNSTVDDTRGFFLVSCQSPILTDNIVENNSALADSFGIALLGGTNGLIKNNIINANLAGDGSTGLLITEDPLTMSVFSNKSINHGSTANNYNIAAGPIPIAQYTVGTASLNITPDPYTTFHNVSGI